MMTPHFKHDCKCCTFLGPVEVPEKISTVDKNLDLYFCEQGGFGSTLIARFSSEGPDYMSGIVFPIGFAKTIIEKGIADNNKEALEYVVENTNSVTEFGLSIAALKAMEIGVIDIDFKKVSQESKKPKMK